MRLAILIVLIWPGLGCEEPPRPWRHWGCHRWDCGDFVNSTEECRGTPSTQRCSSWHCGEGPDLRAEGSFACMREGWADVLPMCLGSTYPQSPGGTWLNAYTVRAVLFQLELSWIPASLYRPELCSGRTGSGALLLPCRRVDFATLVMEKIWMLLLYSLQADLCSPDLSLELPNASWQCKGRVSRYGDRLRLAGVKSQLGGPGELQNLTFFLESIPARAEEAEVLRADLLAVHSSFAQGFWVPPSTWRSADLPELPAAWLVEGLQQLLAEPSLFHVKVDAEFFQEDWLPGLTVRFSKEPYIINSHMVPGWRLESLPEVEVDRNLQHLAIIEEVGHTSFLLLLSLWASAWAVSFGGYGLSMLRGTSWNLISVIRMLGRLGLWAQLLELATYAVLGIVALWLWTNGIEIWERTQVDPDSLTQEMLLLLAPLLAIYPSNVVLLQLLRKPPVPTKTQACHVCCRLRRRGWAWVFCLSVILHGLANGVSLAVAISFPTTKERPMFQGALAVCQQALEARCTTSVGRQVPDTSWETHVECALQCADVSVPAADLILDFRYTACRLLILCQAFSIWLRIWLLWLSCRILQIARKLSRTPGPPAAAAAATAATPETPAPSGPSAPVVAAPRPTSSDVTPEVPVSADELREMLENCMEHREELLDFAKSIAREWAKDSQ